MSDGRISELDQYFPPCGECLFCGHHDKRHRLWDAMIELGNGGEQAEVIADLYDHPLDAVKLVLEIQPYQKKNK